MRLYNLTRRRPLARLQLRHRLAGRLWGLLGRRELPAGEGLWLTPADGIHTWFMRFPIDVLFVAPDLTVLRLYHNLGPWRIACGRGAFSVVELPAGTLERTGTCTGDELALAAGTLEWE